MFLAARARLARLHGEAARRIWLAARPGDDTCAEAFAAAIEKSSAASMTLRLVVLLADLSDEEVIAKVRPHIEPSIRERLAKAGRLPS